MKTLVIRTLFSQLCVVKRLAEENLSVLAQFSGLTRIEIIDEYLYPMDECMDDYDQEECWNQMVVVLRERVRNVSDSVRASLWYGGACDLITPAVEY
jgi:hypothetical protein